MELSVPRNYFNQVEPPTLYLCTTNRARIGVLSAYDVSITAKWNSWSELSFTIDRYRTDIITGQYFIDSLFDKAEGLRIVEVKNVGYYVIQDPDINYGEKDSKTISCFSLEHTASSRYMEHFHINTAEPDSIEVIYHSSKYGDDVTLDGMYKRARPGGYDASESYYHRMYSNARKYEYEQIQIIDEDDYNSHFLYNTDDMSAEDVLYVHGYDNVEFYNPFEPELSLLHCVFKYIPEWKIGHVDYMNNIQQVSELQHQKTQLLQEKESVTQNSNVLDDLNDQIDNIQAMLDSLGEIPLWNKSFKFSEDRVSVYDFLTNTVAEIFGCMIVWDTLNMKVNFYEEENDGLTATGEAKSIFDSDVYISKQNLANEINIKYSTDNIKTKLKVVGGDNMDVTEVNVGQSHIINLDYYHNEEWMEPDVYQAYSDYLLAVNGDPNGEGDAKRGYKKLYTEAKQQWVKANNRCNELENAVPIEGNVVLVGDEFKKLYCIHSIYNHVNEYSQEEIKPTYYIMSENGDFEVANPQPTNQSDIQKTAYYVAGDESTVIASLIRTLNSYHVDDDYQGNIGDNVLLRLRNANNDVATIRIYDKKQEVVSDTFDPTVQYYNRTKSGSIYTYLINRIVSEDNYQSLLNQSSAENCLCINDYRIKVIITRASSGLEEAPFEYSITDWVRGNLRTNKPYTQGGLDRLLGFRIIGIGTMGAYLVLAKNEALPDNLQDYGIRLLEEKETTYTTIFQTQIEAMFAQEKYQCIVAPRKVVDGVIVGPEGVYNDGTKWLDSTGYPATLYEYDSNIVGINKWVVYDSNISETEYYERENYQRYYDNFEKLNAVKKVLLKKKKELKYYRNGYAVESRKIDISSYETGVGSSLESDLQRVAAQQIFGDDWQNKVHMIIGVGLDNKFPIYKFIVAEEDNEMQSLIADYNHKVWLENYAPIERREVFVDKTEKYNIITMGDIPVYINNDSGYLYVNSDEGAYAVYLKDKIPYVSYYRSLGIAQMVMNYYRDQAEFKRFFNDQQWVQVLPLIREDEFNDSNYLITTYESEEERLKVGYQLMREANKKLQTLAQPSLEFSMNMGNILALPEFTPIVNQFKLGNFIRIELRPGIVKKARLLEVQLNFDDLSDFSCTFGNLVTSKSEIDLHAELLKQAVQAGKTVAASEGTWQKAVDRSAKIEQLINDGLQGITLELGKAVGQSITVGPEGLYGRKLKEGTTDQYEDEQVALINNCLCFTNDAWETSRSAFGKYVINGEERWGLISDYINAQVIEGKTLKGCTLQVGEENGQRFVVNNDGSVEIIDANGNNKYASKTDVDVIKDARRFHTVIEYSGQTIFSEPNSSCTLTCKIFSFDTDITADAISNGAKFSWIRNSRFNDTDWNNNHANQTSNQIIIHNSDIDHSASFDVIVEIDDENL